MDRSLNLCQGLVAVLWAGTLFGQQAKVAFEDDFEHGARAEWSSKAIGKTPLGNRHFLGPFGTESVELKLQDLPEHHFVRLTFNVFAMASWDGNDSWNGPDLFCVTSNDGRVLAATTFGWYGPQSFPGFFGVHSALPTSAAIEKNTLGFTYGGEPQDAVYHFDCVLPHTDSAVSFRFMLGGNGDAHDEGWGLDNVKVTLDGVAAPEPATYTNLVDQLGSDNPTIATKAMWALVAGGDQTVAALLNKIKGAMLPAEHTVLDPSRVQFAVQPAQAGAFHVLTQAPQRQVAMALHTLHLMGSPVADLAMTLLQPANPGEQTSELHIAVKEKQSGQPLSNVALRVAASPNSTSYTVFTNSDGEAILIHPDSIRMLRMQTPRTGFVPLSKIINSAGTGRSDVAIEIERGTPIGGIVVDDTGRPVEGAIVKLDMEEFAGNESLSYWDPWTVTDAEGHWSYDLAPSDITAVAVGVFHPGYVIRRSSMIPMTSVPIQNLINKTARQTMRAGVQIMGTVSDNNGKPLPGAWVTWGTPRQTDATLVPAQTTDAEGKFTYTSVAGESVLLTAWAKGYAPQQLQLMMAGDSATARFNLQAAKPFTGRVMNADRKPIPGATIAVSPWRNMVIEKRFMTDDDGRFSWDSAPDDSITVNVMKLGYRTTQTRLAAGEEEQSIPLDPLPAPPERAAIIQS